MSTTELIQSIEALSQTLTDKQLVEFLDIMDAMTLMVEDAKKLSDDLLPAPIKEVQPAVVESKLLH